MADNPYLSYANNSATRNLPVADPLFKAIEEAIAQVYGPGYRGDIISGGQGEGSRGITGSRRHTTLNAADAFVYGPDGGKLPPEKLVPLAQYWQSKGMGGIGFPANGQSMHLDFVGGKHPNAIPAQTGEGMLWYYGNASPEIKKQLAQAWGGTPVVDPATGGVRIQPPTPATRPLNMDTPGLPASEALPGTPAGYRGINMASQAQAAARLPDIGPSGGPTLGGGKVAPVPATRSQPKNPLQQLFGGIVGEDGKLKIPDIKTMLEEGGKNLTSFMQDPGKATRAGLDNMGKNINSGLADWMTNDRVYKGITLGNMMTPGAQRVNTHQGGRNLGTGFLFNPGSNNIGQRNFDAQVHGGQNMDVYRANAAARASGSSNPVMVSMGSRQAGEAPNGMRDTGGGRYETDTGGVYYDRHLSR